MHDDGDVDKAHFLLHPAQEFHAIEVRHHPIKDNQRKGAVLGLQGIPGCQRVAVKLERQSLVFEKLFDDEQVQLFIIDYQNPILPHLQISTPANGGASAVFKAGPLSGTVGVGNHTGLLAVFVPSAFADMAKV